VERITKISSLVRRFESVPAFRYACGFGIMDKTPSESVFSRFKDALSKVHFRIWASLMLIEVFFVYLDLNCNYAGFSIIIFVQTELYAS
jgi:hypothetical protein